MEWETIRPESEVLSPDFPVKAVSVIEVIESMVVSGSPKRWDRDYITPQVRQGL